MVKNKKIKKYYVYMIRCEGNRIYTGITNDIEKRFMQHEGMISGGAKFTKAFKPQKIEKIFIMKNKSEALKLEYKIKQMSKEEKEELIIRSFFCSK